MPDVNVKVGKKNKIKKKTLVPSTPPGHKVLNFAVSLSANSLISHVTFPRFLNK